MSDVQRWCGAFFRTPDLPARVPDWMCELTEGHEGVHAAPSVEQVQDEWPKEYPR